MNWSALLCNCLHNNLNITWFYHLFFLMYILIKNHNHDFSFRTYCINIIYFKGIFALRMKGLHAFLLCYGVHTWNLGWVFFFLIFTLLLTVSQHKTCDVYIFINSAFASKGNINQGGKFWNIESPPFFTILCFDSYLHVFPRIMASMYVHEGWYTQTRKRLKNSLLVVYISLSQ